MLQNIATIGYLPLDPLDPLDRSIFSPPQVTNLSAYPLVPPLPSYGLNRDWAKDLRQRCAKFHPDCACGGANAANILQHVKQFGRTPNAQLVGGLEHFLSHILGIIIPIDFHIFQRAGPTTNQNMIFPTSWIGKLEKVKWSLLSTQDAYAGVQPEG